MGIFDEVDLVCEQVEDELKPMNGWCASGHQAPEFFKKSEFDSAETPTRFFLIKGKGINGTYCEPCLIIANHMAKNKKIY